MGKDAFPWIMYEAVGLVGRHRTIKENICGCDTKILVGEKIKKFQIWKFGTV